MAIFEKHKTLFWVIIGTIILLVVVGVLCLDLIDVDEYIYEYLFNKSGFDLPFFSFLEITLLSLAFLGTILAIKEAYKLRLVEHQPVLSLYIRNNYHPAAEYRNAEEANKRNKILTDWCLIWGEKKDKRDLNNYYLAVRNTGKGVCQKLTILAKDKDGNNLTPIYENRIVAPNTDEQKFRFTEYGPKSPTANEYLKTLDGMEFILKGESVGRKTYSYKFRIENTEEMRVEYLGTGETFGSK